jgi:hypothetical protein
MAFTTKEEFEAIIKEQYDNLSKQDFAELLSNTKSKIYELHLSGDIHFKNGEDGIELTNVSQPFYEIAFNTLKFVKTTRRLSFKQYKCLSAFINSKAKKQEETEYKQF